MQLTAGSTRYFDYGTPERVVLQVRVDRHHDGVAITVTSPCDTTLNRTFTNDELTAGRAYLKRLRGAAIAGQPVWLIEAGVAALTDAAQAVA